MAILARNISASAISQIYVALIGVLFVPQLIRYLGSESYGLIAFFALLQAWFVIVDLGLSSTINRETARFQGGALSTLNYLRLFRSLHLIFLAISLLGFLVLFLSAGFVANSWLHTDSINESIVTACVKIMSITVVLKWLGGLYRGVITGSEKLLWMSVFNASVATIKFVGVFVSMSVFGFTALVFFLHQLAVSIFEVIFLLIKADSLLPSKKFLKEKIGWTLKPIKPVLKFSLTIAFTTIIWVFVTQTDKFLLSGILSLEEFGFFSLGVLIANSVMIFASPISSSVMPRMTYLFAKDKFGELILIYRNATQLTSIVCGSAAITLAVVAEPLLIAWTGDSSLAERTAPIVALYAIGNMFLSVSAYVYYLQYAKGKLYYHLLGNFGLFLFLVPLVFFATKMFGAIGAAYVWVLINTIYLFFWVTYVHYKLESNLHKVWIYNDFFKIVFPASLLGVFIYQLNFHSLDRLLNLYFSIFVGIVVLICCLLSSEKVRLLVVKIIRNKYARFNKKQ